MADLHLSPQTVELLEALSEKLDMSQAAVIEIAVSRMAEQEGAGHAAESTGYAGGGEALLDEVRAEIERESGESDRGEG